MLGITNVSNAPSIVLRDTIAGDNLKPWVSGSYNGYSYRCAIPITGVTADTIAEVTFSQAQAESGNYSSVCTTYDGGLYVYSKVNTTITIPSIIIHSIVETYYELENSPVSGSTKAVTSGGVYDTIGSKGTDTKPLKSVNGVLTPVTNDLALANWTNVTNDLSKMQTAHEILFFAVENNTFIHSTLIPGSKSSAYVGVSAGGNYLNVLIQASGITTISSAGTWTQLSVYVR